MHLTAICPTFRRPKLIPNILAMWEQQEYPRDQCSLLIFDDGQSFESQSGDNWRLLSRPTRCPTLGAKFRETVSLAIAHGTDAIVLFEDDDIYLPGYLTNHAEILANHDVSQSSSIWTNDGVPGKRREHKSIGSHHGSWGFTVDAYRRAGGYPADVNAGFDFQLHARLVRADCTIGRPDHVSPYVYRWQTSGYQNGSGWGKAIYQATEKCHSNTKGGDLTPAMDPETKAAYESTDARSRVHTTIPLT